MSGNADKVIEPLVATVALSGIITGTADTTSLILEVNDRAVVLVLAKLTPTN